ncbi:uncharacterized protein ACRADG_004373 [Cochliomyia hominivorax]
MRLLNTIFIVVLMQLWNQESCQALNTTSNNNGLKICQQNLIQFYQNSISLLAKDFCSKAKQLSEQIVKDVKIQKAVTTKMQEFKQNITTFLHHYSFFQRYGLYNKLLTIFSDMTIGYYHQKPQNKAPDSEYILKLLRENGYDAICDGYENKFIEFIKQQFLPKLEEFKRQLSKEDLEKRQGLKESYKEIQKCRNYYCYYTNFNLLINFIETPKEELFSLINLNLERIMIFYIITANDIVTGLLNDRNIMALNPSVRENFFRNLRDFKEKYENNDKFERIYDLILYFYNYISLKYYHNEEYTIEEQQSIRNLFDQHGFSKLQSYNQILFNNFVQKTLPKIFEQFKKYSSKEDLKKETKLLKWFEDLRKLQTYEERARAFYRFYNFSLEKKI